MALQHDCVSTFIHTHCATGSSLPWIPPHSHCASCQSLSPSLLSTCSASAPNPSRLVLPPSPPRYIENLSSNHLTHKWMEGMFGSGIPPSTLSIPSPTTRSLCGTSWTCRHLFIKVGSFGLLVVASLFPCPSLLSKLAFKFSSANMLLFAYSYYL